MQQFVTAQHSLERLWREWMSTFSWNTSVGSPWQGSSYFNNHAPYVERFYFVVRDMTNTDEWQVYIMVSFTTPCAPSNPSQQKIRHLRLSKLFPIYRTFLPFTTKATTIWMCSITFSELPFFTFFFFFIINNDEGPQVLEEEVQKALKKIKRPGRRTRWHIIRNANSSRRIQYHRNYKTSPH